MSFSLEHNLQNGYASLPETAADPVDRLAGRLSEDGSIHILCRKALYLSSWYELRETRLVFVRRAENSMAHEASDDLSSGSQREGCFFVIEKTSGRQFSLHGAIS